jgi:Zn-dependent protease with chaperone function/RNA polymerase subunit RPABC4/transcription elongation factor Spt4
MSQIRLKNLNETEFTHPFDRRALDTFKKTPGVNTLLSKIWELGLEKILRVDLTSSAIKVNERNFPEIHRLFHEAREILNIPNVIDLYIQNNPAINAYTTGVEKPIITLYNPTIDILTPEELQCVMAHELGHVKCGHVLYHNTADIVLLLGSIAGDLTLGIGNLITTGAKIPLLYWQQMSEFSADRASLLVAQNYRVASGVLMKLAGAGYTYGRKMDETTFNEWIKQGEEFQAYDYDTIQKLYKYWYLLNPWSGKTHPFTVMRSLELKKWIDSGEFNRVMKRETYTEVRPVGMTPCARCGSLLSGEERFCRRCGAPQNTSSTSSEQKFCPSCGFSLSGGVKFCPGCGKKMIE